MGTIDVNSIISYDSEILTSELLDGEMVMMNLDRGQYYGLESVGRKIWELLEKPIKVSTLVDQLMVDYSNVDKETCVVDTIDFLTDLRQEGLVQVHNM